MAKFKHEPTDWAKVGKGLLKVTATLLFWVAGALLVGLVFYFLWDAIIKP